MYVAHFLCYFILLLLPLAEFRAGIEFLCIVSRSNAIQ